jgi:hypothetical protein
VRRQFCEIRLIRRVQSNELEPSFEPITSSSGINQHAFAQIRGQDPGTETYHPASELTVAARNLEDFFSWSDREQSFHRRRDNLEVREIPLPHPLVPEVGVSVPNLLNIGSNGSIDSRGGFLSRRIKGRHANDLRRRSTNQEYIPAGRNASQACVWGESDRDPFICFEILRLFCKWKGRAPANPFQERGFLEQGEEK